MPRATENNYSMTEYNLSAEVKKILGPEWNAPVVEYKFSNGRVFKRRDQDFGCYETSPDFLDGR